MNGASLSRRRCLGSTESHSVTLAMKPDIYGPTAEESAALQLEGSHRSRVHTPSDRAWDSTIAPIPCLPMKETVPERALMQHKIRAPGPEDGALRRPQPLPDAGRHSPHASSPLTARPRPLLLSQMCGRRLRPTSSAAGRCASNRAAAPRGKGSPSL